MSRVAVSAGESVVVWALVQAAERRGWHAVQRFRAAATRQITALHLAEMDRD
jgi:hypothetical protein